MHDIVYVGRGHYGDPLDATGSNAVVQEGRWDRQDLPEIHVELGKRCAIRAITERGFGEGMKSLVLILPHTSAEVTTTAYMVAELGE